MSAILNIGIDLGGRTISASTLPSGTTFSAEYDNKTVVLRTNTGNYIAEYVSNVTGRSRLEIYYNESAYRYLYTYKDSMGADYNDVTLPEDFGVVTEINEDSVSYQYILRTDHEKVYAFTEDLDKVELNGTALYPEVLYVGQRPSGGMAPTTYYLDSDASNYSHMRIYYCTNNDYYSSVDVYDPSGKTVYLMSGSSTSNNSTAYLKAIAVTIGIDVINVNTNTEMNLKVSPSIAYTDAQQVFITRVEAWN